MIDDPVLATQPLENYESAIATLNILRRNKEMFAQGEKIFMVPTQYSTSFTNFRTDPLPELEGRPMLRVSFPEFSGFAQVRKLFTDAGLGEAVINPKSKPGWDEEKDGFLVMHQGTTGIFRDDTACLYFDLLYLEQNIQQLKLLEREGSGKGMSEGKF